jgi:hypothetical protein
MGIRQFLAAIMILLSLSAQARTAFACGMMPGGSLDACCCPAQGKDRCPPGTASGNCCDQVAPADAPFAHAAAEAGGPSFHHAQAEHPGLGPAPHLLPVSFDTGDPVRPADPPHFSSAQSPLYLLTARLRL